MTDVLIFGDSERDRDLRHALPLLVPDPFLYLELDGKAHVVTSSMEQARIDDVAPQIETHPFEKFGYDELIAQGVGMGRAVVGVAARACSALGLRRATVPPT